METFSALLAFCAGNSPVTGWVNNREEAGDLRRQQAHYDVIVMRNLIESTNGNIVITMMSHECHGVSDNWHLHSLFIACSGQRLKTNQI